MLCAAKQPALFTYCAICRGQDRGIRASGVFCIHLRDGLCPRRHLARSQGTLDKTVADDLRTLRELEGQIDVTLREVVDAVKVMKAKGL